MDRPKVRGGIAEQAGKTRRKMSLLFDVPGRYGPQVCKAWLRFTTESATEAVLESASAGATSGAAQAPTRVQPLAGLKGCNMLEVRASHNAAHVNPAREAASDERGPGES